MSDFHFSFTVTVAKTNLVPEVTVTFFTFFIIFLAIMITTFIFYILKLKVCNGEIWSSLVKLFLIFRNSQAGMRERENSRDISLRITEKFNASKARPMVTPARGWRTM